MASTELDPEALAFESALASFVAAHPACWSVVASSVLTFLADALASAVGAVSGGDALPKVYAEGTADYARLDYDVRPSPRPTDIEKWRIVVTQCAAFAQALPLPPGVRVEVQSGIYRFATEARGARVRCTAALIWVHAPGQPGRLVMVPLEAPFRRL